MKKRIILDKYLNCYEVTASICNAIVFKKRYEDYREALENANKLSKEFNIRFEYVSIKRENRSRWDI
ncbi:hypothetical protein NSA50_19065 [Clostridium sp. DSM 100503]|uniref:hypothetical protein n=1 Tax=Clostridium sp. DSM 100503 TaxID=2963282 RepID=UPI002149D4D9|nr:hypothetical protein [Clostridium sp. DSM 100503]MCR1953098.1 hypothetical protein [Clostridium sp. DSM 100503]